MAISNEKKVRDGFSSRWGFILACIGSAVGMGNIWRFPVMVSTYGGLTFLIPYIIFVILIASTGVIEEFAFGRFAAAGPFSAFGKAMEVNATNHNKNTTKYKKIGQGIGLIPVLGSMALAIGYTVVMAWIFKYMFLAITGDLYMMGHDMNAIGGTFGQTASAWGANLWIVITILVAFIIMSFGVSKGIEKANKVMMPILFGLFVLLGIYVATLKGAGAGYKYIFSINLPEFKSFSEMFGFWARVIVYAFGQAFFSLSVAGNGSVIYGSYLSKDENLKTASKNVALFDTIAALLAALVIIPSMATAGEGHLSSGGPGLMFIYLVNVMNGIPLGVVVEIIFFIAVTFAGLSSIINLYEAPIAFMQEELHLGRKLATGIILVIGGIVALCIQAITAEWMDVISIYICPIGALLAAIMFFYVMDRKTALDAVNLGSDKPIGKWFYPVGKYLYCLLALLALVFGAFFGGIG